MTRLLKKIAVEVLGPEKASRIWSRMDIVGDIALIKSPSIAGIEDPVPLSDYRKLAEAVIERLPYVKSVWLLKTPVTGDKLLRAAVHLAGERRSTTIYREHGCAFKVDVLRVFVTPRLNYEHRRVAELAREGEVVVNMFAGAGLFSIIMACRRNVRVYSIDISRDAYELMLENIELNKRRLRGEVVPIHGDAARVVEEKLRGVADRVLEPYPRLALDYLAYALKALKNRGVIHVYLHLEGRSRGELLERASSTVTERIRLMGWSARVQGARVVRPVGPRLYQVVVDVYAERH